MVEAAPRHPDRGRRGRRRRTRSSRSRASRRSAATSGRRWTARRCSRSRTGATRWSRRCSPGGPAAFVPNDVRGGSRGERASARRTAPLARHHRPEHGGQEHGHAPGGAHRAARADGQLRPGAAGARRRRGPDLHARRRVRRPRARPVDLHGRDDRDAPPSSTTRRAARSWSSTRSAAAPPPSTASPSPGRWPSTCTTRSAAARSSRRTTTSCRTSPASGRAVRNLTVAVREVGEQVVFLRKLVPGRRVAELRHRGGEARRAPRRGARRARGRSCGTSRRWRWTRAATPRSRAAGGGAADPASQLGLFAAPGGPGRGGGREGAARARPRRASGPLDALNLLAGWKKKLGG